VNADPVEIFPGKPGEILCRASQACDWDVALFLYSDETNTVPFDATGYVLTGQVFESTSRTSRKLFDISVSGPSAGLDGVTLNRFDLTIASATLEIDEGDYYVWIFGFRSGKKRKLAKGVFRIEA
jgi:hypothetical protein